MKALVSGSKRRAKKNNNNDNNNLAGVFVKSVRKWITNQEICVNGRIDFAKTERVK